MSRPPRRLDEGPAPHRPETPEDAYRRIFYAAVDSLAATLQRRYETGDESVLARVATLALPDASRLALHVEMLGDICTRRGSQEVC